METINTLKKIKVLGISTDFNTCDCCGKTDLSKTVSILDLDNEVILHFGTSCAAKADKYDTLEAAKNAKKEITKTVNNYNETVKSAHMLTFRTLRQMVGVTYIETVGYKVNASQEIIDDCFNKALQHLIGQQTKGVSIFKYA